MDTKKIESLEYEAEAKPAAATPLDDLEPTITISAFHAFTLRALVNHWKQLIEHMGKEDCGLTMEFCDELLEDLGE